MKASKWDSLKPAVYTCLAHHHLEAGTVDHKGYVTPSEGTEREENKGYI
jgi:hypothetical protein